MKAVRLKFDLSTRRLGRAFVVPISTVGRWLKPVTPNHVFPKARYCPVSGDQELRRKVQMLCEIDRHRNYGHRMIRAILRRRYGIRLNRKTVLKMMREMGLAQPKVWRRPLRPRRVEKMRPSYPNQGWQIDMTSFQLSNMSTLFLIVLIDCCSRQILGWSLDRRCRTSEWTSTVRMALEAQGLNTKEACKGLTLRSDNGSQPCSKKFVEFLGSRGIKGQYTGYDSPDDNAYVERVIRTVKEEEVWPNSYDSFSEAHEAIENFVKYYNEERVHSALNYQTPNEFAAACPSLVAA